MQLKNIQKLKVLHIGKYWRKENDYVYNSLIGLRKMNIEVFELNVSIYPEIMDKSNIKPVPDFLSKTRLNWEKIKGILFKFHSKRLEKPQSMNVKRTQGSWGPTWLNWEKIKQILGDFNPDLIICNAGGFAFRPTVVELLKKRYCLLGITLSDPQIFEQCSRVIAPLFDAYMTNTYLCLEKYNRIGVPIKIFQAAVNGDYFRPIPPKEKYKCDVLILGRCHSDRASYVKKLKAEFNVHVYGEQWEKFGIRSKGLVYGKESLSVIASAKIIVVFLTTPDFQKIPKACILEYLACGTLVITDEIPEMSKYLNYGKELVGFKSPQELINKIDYYLKHPKQADEIVRSSRKRIKKEYNWQNQWNIIFNWLRNLNE